MSGRTPAASEKGNAPRSQCRAQPSTHCNWHSVAHAVAAYLLSLSKRLLVDEGAYAIITTRAPSTVGRDTLAAPALPLDPSPNYAIAPCPAMPSRACCGLYTACSPRMRLRDWQPVVVDRAIPDHQSTSEATRAHTQRQRARAR